MELFAPDWKSDNPEKRIKWIEKKANPNNPQNHKILAEIAIHDENRGVCDAAVYRLFLPDLLTQVAMEATFYSVRSSAYKRLGIFWYYDTIIELQDMFLPEYITLFKSPEYIIARKALEDARGQIILTDILKNETSGDDRKKAIERVTDQSVLADIAKNDQDKDIREAAIKKLKDQNEPA